MLNFYFKFQSQIDFLTDSGVEALYTIWHFNFDERNCQTGEGRQKCQGSTKVFYQSLCANSTTRTIYTVTIYKRFRDDTIVIGKRLVSTI